MRTQHAITALLTALTLWVGQNVYASKMDEPLSDLLEELDGLINQEADFVKQKESKIAAIRNRLGTIRTDEERYWVNKMFYEEYSVYNLDSAEMFLHRNMEIAQKLKRSAWISECKIRKSFLLVASGRMEEAEETMKGIDAQKLSQRTRIEYYNQMMYIYSHYLYNTGDTWKSLHDYHLKEEALYRDSAYMATTTKNTDHLWFKAWKYNKTDSALAVIDEINAALANSKFEKRYDAMLAYVQAILYGDNVEDSDEQLMKSLALSAMADVRMQNKDIASLEYLSTMLYNKGDVARAFYYMNYFFRHSQMFHNRVRIDLIAQKHEMMRQAYEGKLKRDDKVLIWCEVIIGILLLSTFGAFVVAGKMHIHENEMRLQVDHMREEMLTAIKEERKTREQLDLATQKLKDFKEKFGVK